MRWVFSETKQGSISPVPSLPNPYFFSQPPPPPPDPDSERMELSNKVSPGILLVIIILAIIFFVSGLLHLLVRFIMRPNHRDPEESDNATVLQGQLQQLFHLHDSGVDQSFIDTLPVFHYKAIIGLKNPFDCAVCLCEFEPEDKLRLLPKCSHAFHMECIDTWLLSHSTCPLCRSNLIPDFSPDNGRSPMVLVLESGRQSSREILTDIESNIFSARTNSNLGLHREDEVGSFRVEIPPKSSEIVDKPEEPSPPVVTTGPQEKVVTVKLGKFRNVDGGGGEESSERNSKDARRCFSMGSFEYVMDERSSLQVPIRTPTKKQPNKKPSLPLKPGLRPAMSECDGESMREFEGLEPIRTGTEIHGTSSNHGNGDRSRRNKRESFSVSKIWLRGKEEKPPPPSRRAFSFRFPVHRSIPGAEEMKGRINGGGGKRSVSEADFGRWESEETESRNSLDSGSSAAAPSLARRTLLWLVGRQNKVVHSPFPPNL